MLSSRDFANEKLLSLKRDSRWKYTAHLPKIPWLSLFNNLTKHKLWKILRRRARTKWENVIVHDMYLYDVVLFSCYWGYFTSSCLGTVVISSQNNIFSMENSNISKTYLLLTEFEGRIVSWGPSFMAQARSSRAINSWGKRIRNLQYRPRNRGL